MRPKRRPRLTSVRPLVVALAGIALLPVRTARAQDSSVDTELTDPPVTGGSSSPPTNVNYVQYGAAFVGEFVTSAGPICEPDPAHSISPCILGSGGGIVFPRIGWRTSGPWYFGGAYELSKQDPNKLYRLAILQQLRFEARYYIPTPYVTTPYLSAGLGVAGYGNEWAIDTWGPAVFAAIGAEAQISRRSVVGIALAYRLIYFKGFTDSSETTRQTGITQLLGLEFSLEGRDPL